MRILLAVFIFLSLGTVEAKSAAPKSNKAVAKAQVKGSHQTAAGRKLYGNRKAKQVHVFNATSFQKLSFKKRKQYFKAIADYLAATSHDKKVAFNFMEWILPSAEAAAFLRNAGFLVTKDDATYKDENFDTRSLLGTFPSECGGDRSMIPCFPGLGVNAAGEAFCVPNTANKQMILCQEKAAKPNSPTDPTTGIENLVKYLETADRADLKYLALKKVMGEQLTRINQECPTPTAGYCTKLNKALSEITGKGQALTQFVDPGVEVPFANTPTTPAESTDGSCAAVSTKAMEQATGKTLDNRWSEAVKLAKRSCGKDFNFENAFKRYGTCFANSRLPNPTMPSGLKAALDGGKTLGTTEQADFMKYFGMSQSEYKTIFCDSSSTTQSFAAKMGEYAKGTNFRKDGCKTSSANPLHSTALALQSFRNSGPTGQANQLNKALMDIYLKLNTNVLPYKENGLAADSGPVMKSVKAMAGVLANDGTTLETVESTLSMNQRQWIMQRLTDSNATLANSFRGYIDAEDKNIKTNGDFAGLDGLDTFACDNSFKGMMSCAKQNLVNAPATGDFGATPELISSFADSCKVMVEKPSILRDAGISENGPVVISSTAPDVKCYLFDNLGPEASPFENRQVNAHNAAFDDQKLTKTIQQLLDLGYAVQQYRCDDTFKVNEVDPGFGRSAM